jgi:hypothetical protein
MRDGQVPPCARRNRSPWCNRTVDDAEMRALPHQLDLRLRAADDRFSIRTSSERRRHKTLG